MSKRGFNNATHRTNGESLNTNVNHCAICLDTLGNKTSTLRCGHEFHANCLSQWTTNSSTCPTCRKRMQIRKYKLPNILDKKESNDHSNVNIWLRNNPGFTVNNSQNFSVYPSHPRYKNRDYLIKYISDRLPEIRKEQALQKVLNNTKWKKHIQRNNKSALRSELYSWFRSHPEIHMSHWDTFMVPAHHPNYAKAFALSAYMRSKYYNMLKNSGNANKPEYSFLKQLRKFNSKMAKKGHTIMN